MGAGRKPKPVCVGDRIGNMEAMKPTASQSIKTSWRCVACGAKHKAKGYALTALLKHGGEGNTGCSKCNTAKRIEKNGSANVRQPTPVKAGEVFGKLAAVNGLPSRSSKGEFRCTVCSTISEVTAAYAKFRGERGCLACNRAAGPNKEELAARRKARMALSSKVNNEILRRAPKVGHMVAGKQCQHEKELICVDPGGVKIMRCRECQMTGEPAWTAPRCNLGATFRERPNYDNDSSSSFENMIRALEDFAPNESDL